MLLYTLQQFISFRVVASSSLITCLGLVIRTIVTLVV